jgi:hypothetical protein
MNNTCTCRGAFRSASDFRDHMPCPGTLEERQISSLELRIKLLEEALRNTIEYAEIVGSPTDEVHIKTMAYAKKELRGK